MQKDHRELLFNDGKKLANWGLLDLVNTDERTYNQFIGALCSEGAMRGLTIANPMYKGSNERDLGKMERDFVALHKDLTKNGKPGTLGFLCRGQS